MKFKEYRISQVETTLAAMAEERGDTDYQRGGVHVTVNEYVERRGVVTLPRDYALKTLHNIDWTDATTYPSCKVPTRSTIEPRDEQQRVFFAGLLREASKSGPQDILANATTGAGKSVAGIYLGTALKTPTLIVVDSNKIANGWLKNFRKFYGDRWTDRYVGRVQQDKCEFKGKAFSIALAQSLASRKYEYPMYSAWGCILYDEVQIYGAEHFSKVLSQFNARVRVGLTATNKKGAFGKIVNAHLGFPRVVSTQEVMRPNVYIIKNKLKSAFYCETDGSLLNGLARVGARNDKLANIIKVRGYERGRVVLVLSNRTAQLQDLYKRCRDRGIPSDAMGIHAGSYATDKFVMYYAYGASNKRNRLKVCPSYSNARTLLGKLKRGDYSDIELPKPLYNRLQAGDDITFSTEREQYKPTQIELDNITNLCQIIFATYEIFSKGVDVPRIDMGVEGLPSGNVTQPLGRVLRILEGKPTPEWYALLDELPPDVAEAIDAEREAEILNSFFESKAEARLRGFKTAKAQVTYK